jgi:hypothetical protein
MLSTKRKEKEPTATINNKSDPVHFLFHRLCSTHCMAGDNVAFETKREQSNGTINNKNDPTSTINSNNLPLPQTSNKKLCVVVVKFE